jgi:hypothetical protein
MNIMVTVKKVDKYGKLTCEIRRSISEVSTQEFTADELIDYLAVMEGMCESRGGRLIWNIPSNIKSMATKWLEPLLEQNTTE